MSKMKKMLAILVCIGLMGALFTGCNKDGTNESQTTQGKSEGQTKVESTTVAEKPMDIKWLSFYPPQTDDSMVQKYLEGKYNIKLTNVRVDRANWSELVNVKLAGGDIPDLFFMWDIGEVATYAEQGVIAEIPIDMIKEYMPKYSATIDELNPVLWKGPSYEGKNYGVQLYWTEGETSFLPAYNGDWMKAVGINKAPETLAEYEDLIRKFTNDDPNKSGKNDTYGITARGKDGLTFAFNSVFGAYGVMPFSWDEDQNGELVFGMVTEGAREAFRKLNQWYSEKLIDPEYIVTDAALERQKFSGGKVGSIMGGQWNSYLPDRSYGQLFKENGIELIVGKPFTGPNGDSGGLAWGSQNNIIGMGIQVADDKDKMAKLLTILEDIAIDPETHLMTCYGEENVHYELVNGVVKLKEGFADAEKRSESIGAGNFYGLFLGKSIPLMGYSWEKDILDLRSERTSNVNSMINKGNFNYPKMNDFPNMKAMQDEYFVKFVVGEVDLDSGFDSFVELWNNSGGKVLTEEINKVYKERK